jgi:hypothetical protein
MNMESGIETYRGSGDGRQGLQLDIAFIIRRLFETFPGIEFEEEYFQRQTELVRQISEGKQNRAAVNIAIRDAEEFGPHFAFTVRSSDGSPLKGGVSRYCLAFKFDKDTVDPKLRKRADQFLACFALNRFEREPTEPSKTAME